MFKCIRASVILAMVGVVTACSGGGGSSSTPTVTLEITPANLTVNEGQSTSFTVKATGGSKITISGGSVSSIQGQGESYLVSAGEVDRTVTETFKFTASRDGYRSKTTTVNVVIENLSGAPTEDAAIATLSTEEGIVSLEEDFNLYRAIIESMYLDMGLTESASASALTPLTYSEKEALLASFNPSQGPYHDLLMQSFDELQDTYSQYSLGQVSEVELENQLSDIQYLIGQHSSYGAQKLASLFQAFYPGIDLETQTSLEFSSEAGRYSRFIGNPEFGSYIDGEWVYEGDFNLLDSVIPNKNNSIGFCEA